MKFFILRYTTKLQFHHHIKTLSADLVKDCNLSNAMHDREQKIIAPVMHHTIEHRIKLETGMTGRAEIAITKKYRTENRVQITSVEFI